MRHPRPGRPPNKPNAFGAFESGEYAIDRSAFPDSTAHVDPLDHGRVFDEHDFFDEGLEATFELNDAPPSSSPKIAFVAGHSAGAAAPPAARFVRGVAHDPSPAFAPRSTPTLVSSAGSPVAKLAAPEARRDIPLGAVTVLVIMGILIGLALRFALD